MIFQVQVNNTGNEKVIITVKDEKGFILYNQSYDNRKIAVNISAFKSEVDKLIFLVRKGNEKKPKTFEVNVTHPYKEEIQIKQL
jgi:shikimate 5-dehydrogenase